MKVSMITSLLDSADAVEALLESVTWQKRAPDEVVVVDGGSTRQELESLTCPQRRKHWRSNLWSLPSRPFDR